MTGGKCQPLSLVEATGAHDTQKERLTHPGKTCMRSMHKLTTTLGCHLFLLDMCAALQDTVGQNVDCLQLNSTQNSFGPDKLVDKSNAMTLLAPSSCTTSVDGATCTASRSCCLSCCLQALASSTMLCPVMRLVAAAAVDGNLQRQYTDSCRGQSRT